jgi:SAM-dependent methyltransferase
MTSDARSAYDRWHLDVLHSSDVETPWLRLFRQFWRQEDFEGRRVLEIGCGRGDFARWLSSNSGAPACLVAGDFSISGVAGRGRNASGRAGRLSWLAADIQDLPFDDRTFDTVLSFETIEHVPHPGVALRELARVLRPGGRLYLTCPSYLNLSGLYRIYLRLRGRRFQEAGQPINQPLLLPLTAKLVRRTGLKVRSTASAEHQLLVPGRPPVRLPNLASRSWARWFGTQCIVVAEKPRE